MVITEFAAKDENLYRQAVTRYGDPNLYVSVEVGPGVSRFSLCCREKCKDLSAFWQHVRGAKKSNAFKGF